MRTLTINKKTITPHRHPIEWNESIVGEIRGDGTIPVTIKCIGKHNLVNKGVVVLSGIVNALPFEKKYNYEIIDEVTFIVFIPEYIMVSVTNYSTVNNSALLELNGENIYRIVKDVTNITLRDISNVFAGHVHLSYDSNGIPTNEEDAASHSIICSSSVGFSGKGFIEIKNDWCWDDEGNFNSNIVFEEDNFVINIPIALHHEPSYRLNDEQKVLNGYFEAVKASIIPEIVDNEKKQFIPVYGVKAPNSVFNEKYYPVKEIEINLHFRSRYDEDKNDGSIRDGWKTTDEQIWNGMILGSNNKLSYKVNGFTDSNADSLDALGFTEDDIRFSKTKVDKTFIRLMFYSSKDMLKKELLYYSTIFLDSGELYKKYCTISSLGLKAFDSGRTDENLRLSAKFSVKGKYNASKSSEGFYLYLFPSEIDGETLPKTIYMKLEFNHAGYGKTVPMMLPRDNSGKVVNANTISFPINFTPSNNGKVDFDFEAYQDAVMVPLEIWFDNNIQEYVYRFPFADRSDGKVVLNFFEPRVRG